jgi:hypothetical protein
MLDRKVKAGRHFIVLLTASGVRSSAMEKTDEVDDEVAAHRSLFILK